MIIPSSWKITSPQLRLTNKQSTSFTPFLENPMSHTDNNYVHRETEASDSLAHDDQSPYQPKVELNLCTPSMPIGSDPKMAKRIYHNASERDRRKKMNALYSTLRSLLPSADQAVPIKIHSFIHSFFLSLYWSSWDFPRKLIEESIALSSSH